MSHVGVMDNLTGQFSNKYNTNYSVVSANICCVCLSQERSLSTLSFLRSTYEMLMKDFTFEGAPLSCESLTVCWECSALLRRISLFKQRAHSAQLTLITTNSSIKTNLNSEDTKHLATLSQLKVILKSTYDIIFEHKSKPTDKDPGETVHYKLEGVKIEIRDSDNPIDADEFPLDIASIIDPKPEVTATDNIDDDFNSDEMLPLTELVDDLERLTEKPTKRVLRHLAKSKEKALKKRHKLKKRESRKERENNIKLTSEKRIEWKCRDCGQVFVTRGKMTYHQRTVHSDPVLCNECGRVFSFKPTLEKHMLTHFGGIPQYPCHLCGKSFAGRGGIKSHMIHVHQASHETYRCEQCDLTFKTKYKYKSHIKWSKRHGGQGTEKHECEKCNRRYKTKQRLFEHFSFQHLGKAAHKCTICEKEISSLLGLKKHIKYVHEGQEKPRTHVCETCGDAFKQVSMLRQHQYIHTGEKPYSCDVCGALFRQKGSLYTHRRLVHLKIKRNSNKVASNTT